MADAIRIWALHCPFDKHGAPVLGTSGRTIQGVVVLRVEDWTQLCQEHPSLGKQQFMVGTASAEKEPTDDK